MASLKAKQIIAQRSLRILVGDYTYVAFSINDVRSDEELIAFPVDHSVGRRTARTFGPDRKMKRIVNFI